MASKSYAALALVLSLNIIFASVAAGGLQKANPKPTPAPTTSTSCPVDTIKLGICADLLGGLVNVTIGTPPVEPCCSLISGLVDLEAAACVCVVIEADVLGINVDVPVALSLLLNACSKEVPPGFICA